MRIALIPSDLGACCFYRLAWPATVVKEITGWEVELYHPAAVSLSPSGLKIVGLDPEGLDLVVVQRIMSPRQVRMIEAFQMRGVAVVVDVDDAIWRIDPRNKAHAGWNEIVEGKRRWEWLDEACARADLVTVSTPGLTGRYGSHGRVKVMRNGLPNVAFASDVKTRFQGRIKIGWAGDVGTHPGDLEVLGGAVARIMRNNDDVDLHIVGDAEPVADILSIPKDMQFSSRVSGTGWVPLDQYHAALRGIDIMLVPLADTPFNRAKSALKAQEGAAAGAVVLASATPENERLYDLGGFTGGIIRGADASVWHMVLNDSLKLTRSGGWVRPGPEQARFLDYQERAAEWVEAWGGAIWTRRTLND